MPAADADRVREALARAGAGVIGDYDSASFSTPGEGRFRPLAGANPTIGEVGGLEVVDEVRIECVLARAARPGRGRGDAGRHPYRSRRRRRGAGRPGRGGDRVRPDGQVEETTLAGFAQRVGGALPRTAQGVRVAGDPDRTVRKVAVCGGAGDFLLDDVRRRDVDAYVTSDLRHHPASEFLEHGGPRWSTSRTGQPSGPGCRWWPGRFGDALGDTVETRVGTICTDPWNARTTGEER